jgi:hypothetical protein
LSTSDGPNGAATDLATDRVVLDPGTAIPQATIVRCFREHRPEAN